MSDYWKDVGDYFREASKEKRANNRNGSLGMLLGAGIKAEIKNKGAHLIVDGPLGKIDFWPGTGLWIDRISPKRKRGVRELIRYIKKKRIEI